MKETELHFRAVPRGTPGARPIRYSHRTPIPWRLTTGPLGYRRRVDHARDLKIARLQRRVARRHGCPIRYATTTVEVYVITDPDLARADERASAAERFADGLGFKLDPWQAFRLRYLYASQVPRKLPLLGGSGV